MTNKAFLNKFIQHIQAWEGKLGGSPNDTGAIKNGGYAPGTKYHTSKGVTWGTYKDFCIKNGYPIKVQRWLDMPIDLWTKILNRVFIDKWNLDKLLLVNPKLAYFIIEVAWMSSNMGAEKFFANYLRAKGIEDNDIKPSEMQKYFLQLIAQGDFDINELYRGRSEQYKTFRNYNIYGRGWQNRLNAYKKL
jgi:lysozyme family protein